MIPFGDLKAQYASIRGEVNAAMQGVLDSCQFTLGSEVAKFEEEFAAFSGVKLGVGVNTGTSALHLALLAADIDPGDEVITVPFTFVATVAAIHYTSALTAVDVSFLAEAIGAGTASQEQLASAALDREFEQSDAQDRANDAVKDAPLAGIGWGKVGYEYFAEEQELPRPQAAVAADVQKLIEAAEAEGRALKVDIIQNLVPLTEVREVNLSQRIVVDLIPWDEIIWDPEAKTWRNVKWLCQIEKAEPEDVKQNPLYVDYCKRNRQSKRLQELASDETLSVSGVLQTVQPAEEDERITIYHMYDLETGTLCIFAKGEDFLPCEGRTKRKLYLLWRVPTRLSGWCLDRESEPHQRSDMAIGPDEDHLYFLRVWLPAGA